MFTTTETLPDTYQSRHTSKKIRVCSFDFDECIDFKPEKDEEITIEQFICKNNNLIAYLKDSHIKEGFNDQIIFVGSNRQSLTFDISNGSDNQNGSCFQAIKLISEHLGARSDPFLLADIFAGDEFPENKNTLLTFFAILEELHLSETFLSRFDGLLRVEHHIKIKALMSKEHPHQFFDEGKLNIIYAQMCKVACEHSDNLITFDFFDDREYILKTLSTYFNTYKDSMIPKNVTLRLFKYSKAEQEAQDIIDLSCFDEIHGNASLDTHWQDTVRKMSMIAGGRPMYYAECDAMTPALIFGHSIATQTRPTQGKPLAPKLGDLSNSMMFRKRRTAAGVAAESSSTAVLAQAATTDASEKAVSSEPTVLALTL